MDLDGPGQTMVWPTSGNGEMKFHLLTPDCWITSPKNSSLLDFMLQISSLPSVEPSEVSIIAVQRVAVFRPLLCFSPFLSILLQL